MIRAGFGVTAGGRPGAVESLSNVDWVSGAMHGERSSELKRASAPRARSRPRRSNKPSPPPSGHRRPPLPRLAIAPYFCFPDGVLGAHFAAYVTVRITEMFQSVDDLQVTAASSALSLPRRLEPNEIGQLLGVDYVLKGQIVRREQTLYFTQWLHEVPHGGLVLPVEIECDLGDLESFERNVLARVIADVRQPLQENEIDRIMSRRRRNPSAYELAVRAQVAMHDMDRQSFAQANRLLKRALAIDPGYATAYAWQARYHSIRIGQGWARKPKAEAREALRLAEAAITLDPDNAIALATAGHLQSFLNRNYEEAEHLLMRATASCSNEPLGWLLLGATLAYLGRCDEARSYAEYALTLSPLDSCLYSFLGFASVICYAQGDFEQAVKYAHEAIALNPRYTSVLKTLTVSLVAMGNVREAREVAGRLRELAPSYTERAATDSLPFRDAAMLELSLRRLRTAGVFEAT